MTLIITWSSNECRRTAVGGELLLGRAVVHVGDAHRQDGCRAHADEEPRDDEERQVVGERLAAARLGLTGVEPRAVRPAEAVLRQDAGAAGAVHGGRELRDEGEDAADGHGHEAEGARAGPVHPAEHGQQAH